MSKSQFLQIRVTPKEKAKLRSLARRAGLDLSSYVMLRSLPPAQVRFDDIMEELLVSGDSSCVLAGLSDFLNEVGGDELSALVEPARMDELDAFLCCYVAAMVEQACSLKAVRIPEWVRDVGPLESPWFATELRSLRTHLLLSSPVPFKRRNLFCRCVRWSQSLGMASRLSRDDMMRLFSLLNDELAAEETTGELNLVGGAVMCLALMVRDATQGVDAVFAPTRAIREAAHRVAACGDVPASWLNDAVKGFLGTRGEYDSFLELSNLRIYVAKPEYLLAMKCSAMRLGAEFHDLDDVRFLLRYLNIETTEEALRVVTEYFPESTLMPKTRLALEELLE